MKRQARLEISARIQLGVLLRNDNSLRFLDIRACSKIERVNHWQCFGRKEGVGSIEHRALWEANFDPIFQP